MELLIHLGYDFNPRTREGCDLDTLDTVDVYPSISIHAPVKGATDTEDV